MLGALLVEKLDLFLHDSQNSSVSKISFLQVILDSVFVKNKRENFTNLLEELQTSNLIGDLWGIKVENSVCFLKLIG